MTRITDALADSLGRSPSVDVRLGSSVVSLESLGAAYRLVLSDGSPVDCDAVVLTSPAPVAAGILDSAAPATSAALRTIRYGSATIVSLAYRADQLTRPVVGHGYVVAADAANPLSACTITSGKWPGRAPDGTVLIRAFLRTEGDGALPACVGTGASPARGRSSAHPRAARGADPRPCRPVTARCQHAPLPDRVAAAYGAGGLPGVALAGAAYCGVGLPTA
jgi:oxygen-dependent protoporphyrinogen oxidase